MPSIRTSNYNDTNWEQHKDAGTRVKEAIKENEKILKEQIKEATSWEYEPE